MLKLLLKECIGQNAPKIVNKVFNLFDFIQLRLQVLLSLKSPGQKNGVSLTTRRSCWHKKGILTMNAWKL